MFPVGIVNILTELLSNGIITGNCRSRLYVFVHNWRHVFVLADVAVIKRELL